MNARRNWTSRPLARGPGSWRVHCRQSAGWGSSTVTSPASGRTAVEELSRQSVRWLSSGRHSRRGTRSIGTSPSDRPSDSWRIGSGTVSFDRCPEPSERIQLRPCSRCRRAAVELPGRTRTACHRCRSTSCRSTSCRSTSYRSTSGRPGAASRRGRPRTDSHSMGPPRRRNRTGSRPPPFSRVRAFGTKRHAPRAVTAVRAVARAETPGIVADRFRSALEPPDRRRGRWTRPRVPTSIAWPRRHPRSGCDSAPACC